MPLMEGLLLLGVMARHPWRKGPGGHEIFHAGHLLHDSFFVHGIVERLAHASIVKGLGLCVKPCKKEAEHRFADALRLPVLRIAVDLVCLHDGENHIFQNSLQEFSKSLLNLVPNAYLVYVTVKIRPPRAVLVIGVQYDLLVWLPPDKLKRPGPYRRASKAIPLPFRLFLGDDRGVVLLRWRYARPSS
jgi:hypothetical protein